MSDFTVSRLGQVNASGDAKAIFLEVFSGEVLEAFDTLQLTMDRQLVKTIKNGKSEQFPRIWKASASYHTPGAELAGTPIKHAKKTINIEDLLVSDVFIDKLDEAMNHYDTRAPYSHQLAEALANIYDKNSFRALARGAEASNPFGETAYDGTPIQVADLSITSTVLKTAVYDAAQTFDEQDVPASDRFAAFLPLAWYLLLEDGEFINRDYAGEGSKARAQLPWASDLNVLKSNNIATDDSSADTSVPSILRGDDSQLVAAVWHRTAMGTVKLLDLDMEEEYTVRHKGTLMTADYALGQDWLRPESIVTMEDTNI